MELDGLYRRYGDRVALDGLTFTVRPGQLLRFVGPNGAGKTTAMRIVLGVLEPDAGEVRFEGRPLDAATRARFGSMPEERALCPTMAVGRQVAYLAELHGLDRGAARQAAARWMARVGIADRAGDRVEALSPGNQQRVQLAAALVRDPIALVLDEPFSGLDPVGVDVMAQVLVERARAGVPVVFSSHRLDRSGCGPSRAPPAQAATSAACSYASATTCVGPAGHRLAGRDERGLSSAPPTAPTNRRCSTPAASAAASPPSRRCRSSSARRSPRQRTSGHGARRPPRDHRAAVAALLPRLDRG